MQSRGTPDQPPHARTTPGGHSAAQDAARWSQFREGDCLPVQCVHRSVRCTTDGEYQCPGTRIGALYLRSFRRRCIEAVLHRRLDRHEDDRKNKRHVDQGHHIDCRPRAAAARLCHSHTDSSAHHERCASRVRVQRECRNEICRKRVIVLGGRACGMAACSDSRPALQSGHRHNGHCALWLHTAFSGAPGGPSLAPGDAHTMTRSPAQWPSARSGSNSEDRGTPGSSRLVMSPHMECAC